MNALIFILYSMLILSCSSPDSGKIDSGLSASEPDYIWTRLSDHADWKESYNFQMFAIRDTVWTFHSDGNWYSVDGFNWQKSELSNAVCNLAFLDYVLFHDAIYGLSYFEGNIEKFTWKNEIYKTTNLKTWEIYSEVSNIPKRFFYHPFVFRDSLWLIGGQDQHRQYSDCWSSADGIIWMQQAIDLPFGKRSGSQVMLLRDSLYVLGNDVWKSADARNWERVTEEIVAGEQIFGYHALVFDERIWLLGCNRNGQFTSQVIYSSDGLHWKQQEAPWSPRGGIAAAVYKDRIIMTGGKYGGTADHPEFRYSNDIWVMERKK